MKKIKPIVIAIMSIIVLNLYLDFSRRFSICSYSVADVVSEKLNISKSMISFKLFSFKDSIDIKSKTWEMNSVFYIDDIKCKNFAVMNYDVVWNLTYLNCSCENGTQIVVEKR